MIASAQCVMGNTGSLMHIHLPTKKREKIPAIDNNYYYNIAKTATLRCSKNRERVWFNLTQEHLIDITDKHDSILAMPIFEV